MTPAFFRPPPDGGRGRRDLCNGDARCRSRRKAGARVRCSAPLTRTRAGAMLNRRLAWGERCAPEAAIKEDL